jgi:predicted metal-dependent phosphoesterase TrpH/DNA repair ATPase RecN
MTSKYTNFAGARWWKFDFHTHSPASADYGRSRVAAKSTTPREWLISFMNAEIDCVAITDHNSGEWIELLQEELKSLSATNDPEYRPLFLFPGAEISTNGGVHVLAIFEIGTRSHTVSTLLGACGYGGSQGSTDTVTRSSPDEVIQLIHHHGGIAIPAHVDKANGLFEMLKGPGRGPSLNAVSHSDLLAIELCDANYAKPQVYIESERNLAEVLGSDAHDPESVGKKFTYVKMGEPCLDALKLALHDRDDGVLRNDGSDVAPGPAISDRLILKSLTVTDGAKAGRGSPLKVLFSPWLSAIIGGRGSGKSAVLNYLRIVLDQVEGLPDSVNNEFENFNLHYVRGKRGMLREDTTIRLELFKDGREIAIEWRSGVWAEFSMKNGSWIANGNPGRISERFPVRLFGQKQLYEMTDEPDAVLKIVDGLFDKGKWETQLAELTKSWLRSRSREREIRSQIDSGEILAKQLEDVAAKINVFEESGFKEILESYGMASGIKSKISSILTFDKFCEDLSRVQSSLPLAKMSSDLEGQIGEESYSKIKSLLDRWEGVAFQLKSACDLVNAFQTEFGQEIEQLPCMISIKLATEAFQALGLKLRDAGGMQVDGYGELIERRQELSLKIARINEKKAELSIQAAQSREIFEAIVLHQRTLRDLRKSVITKWNAAAGENGLTVSLEVMGNSNQANESIRTLIRKPGTEFSSILLPDVETGTVGELSRFISPVENEIWQIRNSVVSKLALANEDDHRGLGKKIGKHLQTLRTNTPEDIDRIEIWFPEDHVALKLKRNGQTEDIESGSAGQRTAGMLALLLSLDDRPLILDQPEDDLDTRLITDLIVRGLRNLKDKQQVIVVTHNPNIPVNGVAEQIVEMTFKGGQIVVGSSGALQDGTVRAAICDIMEGGHQALSSRYFRVARALYKNNRKR